MKHLREYRPPAHHSDDEDDHDDEDEDVRDVNEEMIAAMTGDSIPHHHQHHQHHHHAPPPLPFGHAPPAHAIGKEEGGMGGGGGGGLGGGGGSDWLPQMQAFMLSPDTLADPVHIGPYYRALEKLIDASKEGLQVRFPALITGALSSPYVDIETPPSRNMNSSPLLHPHHTTTSHLSVRRPWRARSTASSAICTTTR